MEPDETLCYCFHIPKRKIVNYVRRERPRRASQISECFGAGTGCGWCIPYLTQIHRDVVEGREPGVDDLSAEEYEALRRAYLDEVREGIRDANALRPSENRAPGGDERASSIDSEGTGAEVEPSRGETPPDEADGSATAASDDDWDVSHYFSRSRPAEPEPDLLEE